MIGSTISGVTFVSVPGMVQASGFSYLQIGTGIYRRTVHYRIHTRSAFLPDESGFYLWISWKSLRSFLPIRQEPGFFFISKMLGAAVRLFFSMSDLAITHLRAFPYSLYNQCHTDSTHCLALYFPGRSEIIDMDWCTENILSGSLRRTLYLLYSFQPASEFQRIGLNDFRQRSLQNVLFWRCQRQAIFLQAIPGRSLYRYRHERAGSGYDATESQLQELPWLTEEYDYKRDFTVLCDPALPDAGCLALYFHRPTGNRESR